MLPLELLFRKLQAAGFDTSTRVRLLAMEALWKEGNSYIGNIADLKYLLAPLLAKTAWQQAEFYKIFDAFLDDCLLEADKLEEPDQDKEQPSTTPSGRTNLPLSGQWLWWLIPLVFLLIIGYWISSDKDGETQAVRLCHEMPLLREGEVLYCENSSTGFIPTDTAFTWLIENLRTHEVVYQSATMDLEWKANGYGDDMRIILQHASGLADTAQVHIHCQTAPIITEGSAFPTANLVEGQSYQLDIQTDKDALVRWVIDGDTLDNPTPEYQFKRAGIVYAQCLVYRAGARNDCYTQKQYTFNVGMNKPVMPLRTLQLDQSEYIGQLAQWVWWLLLLPLLLVSYLYYHWWQQLGRENKTIKKSASQLEAAFPIHDKGPYFIPYEDRSKLINVPPSFFKMADVLRRREESLNSNFNVSASVRATVRSGGFPQLLEVSDTSPGNYLCLVARRTERDQQGRLFERLTTFLKQQEAPLETWFHDGSFRQFWQKNKEETLSLEQLQNRFFNHRLILIGDGEQLLNPHDTQQGDLHKHLKQIFLRWPKRLLLTPVPVASWTYLEKRLYRYFLLYPADSRGILEGLEALDALEEFEPGQYSKWEAAQAKNRIVYNTHRHSWKELADHRQFFSDDPAAFRWLCGLAISPSPDWSLTLAIGHALGIKVSHDRLLALTNIPWLAANEDHTRLRLQLQAELSTEDYLAARKAFNEELNSKVVQEKVAGSLAGLERTSHQAVQAFTLRPSDTIQKQLVRDLRDAGLLSGGQLEELDFVVKHRISRKDGQANDAINKLDDWLDTPQKKFLWTRGLIVALTITVLTVLLALMGWWYNKLQPPVQHQNEQLLLTYQKLDDKALQWHNQAVDIAERIRQITDYTDWQNGQDSSLIVDSLFDLARNARQQGYGLADSNLTAFHYNMASQHFNFYLDQAGDVGVLQTVLSRFNRAARPDIAGEIAIDVVLDAMHGQGLSYYYLFKADEKNTLYCDSATAKYDALLTATDSLYFMAVESEMPIHLATLLEQESCNPEAAKPVNNGALRVRVNDEVTGQAIVGAKITPKNYPAFFSKREGVATYVLNKPSPTERIWVVITADNYETNSTSLPVWIGVGVTQVYLKAIKATETIPVLENPDVTQPENSVPAPPTILDRDQDGVADKDDTCPDVKGYISLQGCPDKDRDGVRDQLDQCPEIAGLSYLNGCPDQDYDGVADKDDECPTVPGLAELKGCPDERRSGNALEAYSEAQYYFNAVSSELRSLNDPSDKLLYRKFGSSDEEASIVGYLSRAATEIDYAISKGRTLEKAGILGNAYALKALIQWQLGQYTAAEETSKAALVLLSENTGNGTDSRDFILMKALPSLISLDLNYERTKAMQVTDVIIEDLIEAPSKDKQAFYTIQKNEFNRTYATYSSSSSTIDQLISELQQDSDMILYLLNVKLSGMETWGDALSNLYNTARRLNINNLAPGELNWIDNQRATYEGARSTALAQLANNLAGGTSNKLYEYWVRIL